MKAESHITIFRVSRHMVPYRKGDLGCVFTTILLLFSDYNPTQCVGMPETEAEDHNHFSISESVST